MSTDPEPRTLGAVLFEGFELLDLYGPLEMFGCLPNEVRIETVAEQAGPVRSGPGPATVAAQAFADAPAFDLILVPGGSGVFAGLESAPLLDFLRRASEKAELTMSVCNGSALLAKAGVLDGKRATSNKIFFDHAEEQSDAVDWQPEARWVDDGDVVTSSGVSAGTDMALAVIERLYGRDRAEAIAIVTEYEWQRDAAKDPFHAYLNRKDLMARVLGAAS